MNKNIKEVVKCIFLGLCLGGVVILGIISCQQDRELRLLQIEYNGINNENITGIIQKLDTLNKKIENLPNEISLEKIKVEQELKQINITVINKTVGSLGSGVSIKYKGKYYILSAGHMAESINDELYLYENGIEICKLKIVKSDFNNNEDQIINDLLLLAPIDSNIQPRYCTELANTEPLTGTEIYVVGNPTGIEDVITDGRNILYDENFMYIIAPTYFGNSGGGIYNYEGKVIGIMSHISNLKPEPILNAPDYIIAGVVRLTAILEFMEEVN